MAVRDITRRVGSRHGPGQARVMSTRADETASRAALAVHECHANVTEPWLAGTRPGPGTGHVLCYIGMPASRRIDASSCAFWGACASWRCGSSAAGDQRLLLKS